MSLSWISWLCRDRPEVCTWYLSIWERLAPPYRSRIATAQIRRATRPITVYSGSIPFEKKKERLGANESIGMPRAR